jgi:RNA polymerase sigma-70 factor (ECF subfamily)
MAIVDPGTMTRQLGTRPGALDGDGFARLYAEAAPNLWALAAAILGDRVGAEDVLQEAALIALAKLDQFEPGTSFPAWMGRIVRFVALNQARKRVDHLLPTEEIDDGWDRWDRWEQTAAGSVPESEPSVEDLLALDGDQAHFDDLVVAALRELAPVARACLILRSVRRLDYTELSELLGIPRGTAMSHVHRARNFLRERLRGYPEGNDVAPAKAASEERAR